MQRAGTGLIGKAPCQADFVRLQAGDPICQKLLSFLEQASLPLRQAGAPIWSEPVGFFFCLPGEARALFGMVGPSEDQVGRSFPLAVFSLLEAQTISKAYPSLPVAGAAFLAAARTLLEDAKGLSTDELSLRVRALPAIADPQAAPEVRAVLGSPSAALMTTLQGGGPDVAFYAFRTFLTACANERGAPAKGQIVLDCPYPVELGPLPWLELGRRVLGNAAAPPTFFWSASGPGRVLLCLGQPSTQLFTYLLRPDQQSMKLWPLFTRHPQAIATAKSALSATHRAAIERSTGSLDELLTSLSA